MLPMKLRCLWVALAGASIFFAGCTSGPKLLPESMLAAEAATQFHHMKQQKPLSTNQTHIDQVERVGFRIAEVAAPYIDSAAWEFVVFEDDALNAFAMPGGKIGFYSGIVELAGNDDELAVVMGHEIAHVLLRHGNQRVSAELLRSLGAMALAYGTRNQEQHTQLALMAVYGLGTEVGFMLPYSRNHETEADEIGLMLMAMAGYDPDAGARFWAKMEERAGRSGVPEWLSTHPNPGNRIRNLERLAEQIKAYPPDELPIR